MLIIWFVDWTTLYLSGRLHKPVHVIHSTHDAAIDAAIRTNLESAMHASLLLLPDYFTETQLFLTVASLSYSGLCSQLFSIVYSLSHCT